MVVQIMPVTFVIRAVHVELRSQPIHVVVVAPTRISAPNYGDAPGSSP